MPHITSYIQCIGFQLNSGQPAKNIIQSYHCHGYNGLLYKSVYKYRHINFADTLTLKLYCIQ